MTAAPGGGDLRSHIGGRWSPGPVVLPPKGETGVANFSNSADLDVLRGAVRRGKLAGPVNGSCFAVRVGRDCRTGIVMFPTV